MSKARAALILSSMAIFAVVGCASRQPAGTTSAASTSAIQPALGGTGALGAGRDFGAAPYGGAAAAAVSQAELREFADTVGDRIYFALDSRALDGAALATLDRQARWLLARPSLRIMVAGHADERGTREYNLALGSRRAAAARDHLVSRGVPAARIDTVSYGKERPVDDRSNENGWAINRNAHSILLNGQPLS